MKRLYEFKNRYQWDTEANGIGGGGFGSVYKAKDTKENCYVAIKISEVKPEFGDYTLQREFDLVKDLPVHRNIARYKYCFRFKTDTGIFDHAVLKYYEYGNLEQFLTKRTLQQDPLTPEEMYILVEGILQGIGFLHQNGIIHRDIKAQNVLMEREDGVWVPKIADFGLSRESNLDASISRGIAISYPYAAPEQLPANDLLPNPQKIKANVDLWAIGVMIHRIVGNKNPFMPDNSLNMTNDDARIELIRRIWNVTLPASVQHLPQPYQAMIRLCLVKDVSKRVQTAAELLALMGQKSLVRDQNSLVTSSKKPIIEMGGSRTSPLSVKSFGYAGLGLLILGAGIYQLNLKKQDMPIPNQVTLDARAVIAVSSKDKEMPTNEVVSDSTKQKAAATNTPPAKIVVPPVAPPSVVPPSIAPPPTAPIGDRVTAERLRTVKDNELPISKNMDNNDNTVYEYESNDKMIRLVGMDWGYLRNRLSCLETGQNLGIKLTINTLGSVEKAEYYAPTSENMDLNRDRKCIDMAKSVCQNFTCRGEKQGQPVRFSLILHGEKK